MYCGEKDPQSGCRSVCQSHFNPPLHVECGKGTSGYITNISNFNSHSPYEGGHVFVGTPALPLKIWIYTLHMEEDFTVSVAFYHCITLNLYSTCEKGRSDRRILHYSPIGSQPTFFTWRRTLTFQYIVLFSTHTPRVKRDVLIGIFCTTVRRLSTYPLNMEGDMRETRSVKCSIGFQSISST